MSDSKVMVPLVTRVPPELIERLDAIAQAEDRSRSNVQRRALKAYVEHHEREAEHGRNGAA